MLGVTLYSSIIGNVMAKYYFVELLMLCYHD